MDCAILTAVKRWKMFVFINVAGLIGAFLAMFTIPQNTPVWMWALCSVGTITVFNIVVYRRFWRGKPSKTNRF
jgi:hypothetical protein